MLNREESHSKIDCSSSVRMAKSLINEADALISARRYIEALIYCERVLTQFDKAQDGELGRQIRTALARKGGLLLILDRLDEADVAFNELCERTKHASDPDRALVQVQEIIAKTLHARAKSLLREKRYEKAIAVIDTLLARVGESQDPDQRSWVAIALQSKSIALERTGDYERALQVEREAYSRFILDPPSARPYAALAALSSQAWLLGKLGRIQEAIASYDQVVQRYGAEIDLYPREKVADALLRKALLLREDGRGEAAVTALDMLLDRFGKAEEPGLCASVANGLHYKALALGDACRWEEAIAIDEELVARFSDTKEPGLVETLAHTLGHLAYCLKQVGKWERSLAVWNEVAERYGDASAPALSDLVARALREKARLLPATGQSAAAVVLADSLIERAGDQPERLAEALVAKGTALLADQRWEETVELFNDVISRFKDAQEPGLRHSMAVALCAKATALDWLGHRDASSVAFEELANHYAEEALEIFNDVTEHVVPAPGWQVSEVLASALYGKACVLGKLDRNDEALRILDELIERFENNDDEMLQQIVCDARLSREELIDGGAGSAT